MKKDANLENLHVELANRFRALGNLFSQLGSSAVIAGLLDPLTSDDPKLFDQFSNQIKLPMLGKCFWLREIIERVIVTPSGLVTECWLRDDLSQSERLLYIQIVLRHRRNQTTVAQADPTVLTVLTGRIIIPEGPFLDELKANGLVKCETRMTYDSRITLVLSKPERVCV